MENSSSCEFLFCSFALALVRRNLSSLVCRQWLLFSSSFSSFSASSSADLFFSCAVLVGSREDKSVVAEGEPREDFSLSRNHLAPHSLPAGSSAPPDERTNGENFSSPTRKNPPPRVYASLALPLSFSCLLFQLPDQQLLSLLPGYLYVHTGTGMCMYG